MSNGASPKKQESKPVHPLLALRQHMESRVHELSAALPTHIPPERFIRVVLTAVQLNPDLLTVDRQSLWNACLRAAQDGLLPDGRESVILPYRDNRAQKVVAQYQAMIGGMLKRFRNSGQFKTIATDVVREGEEFTYWKDENGEHLRHVPGEGDGKIIKAYAIAHTINGGVMIRVMSQASIEKRRAVSKVPNGPMWKDWYDEACMKTVLRNLAKSLPMSSDLDDLIRRDDELYTREPSAGASAALEHFTAGITTNGGGEQPQIEQPQPEAAGAGAAETIATESEEALNAYEQGKVARTNGMNRRAVPPEYRVPEASALAKAWLNGWDAAGT